MKKETPIFDAFAQHATEDFQAGLVIGDIITGTLFALLPIAALVLRNGSKTTLVFSVPFTLRFPQRGQGDSGSYF